MATLDIKGTLTRLIKELTKARYFLTVGPDELPLSSPSYLSSIVSSDEGTYSVS
ncbi:2270_t:CDS:1, partial [Racocetra persica]